MKSFLKLTSLNDSNSIFVGNQDEGFQFPFNFLTYLYHLYGEILIKDGVYVI